jgi:hypothetical protein
LPTFKIPIITGRNFSPDFPSDSTHSVIVNESFVKEAGWDIQKLLEKPLPMMMTNVGNHCWGYKRLSFHSLKEKLLPNCFQ